MAARAGERHHHRAGARGRDLQRRVDRVVARRRDVALALEHGGAERAARRASGCTWNQAAPARLVESPATFTAVVSSPQMLPPMNWVCCMRSSPESILLAPPCCWARGGTA